MKIRCYQHGLSLIELIVFIVVISFAFTGVIIAFTTMSRGTPTPQQLTLATHYAQERMEMILAQKRVVGFQCFAATNFDPCNTVANVPPAGCTTIATIATGGCAALPPGYSFTPAPTFTPNNPTVNDNQITVIVNGPQGQLAQLQAFVSNY
jgi:type II secretory pathway pseudopilin PulG